MNILGIIDGQHDTTACMLKDGKLVAATGEERITRVKLQGGFPYQAVDEVLRLSKLTPNEVDIIAVGSILTPPLFARMFRSVQQKESEILSEKRRDLISFLSHFVKYTLKLSVTNPESFSGRVQKLFVKWVFRRSLPPSLKKKPIFIVNHHLSHAAAAYFNSGKKNALVISADCWGDGLSLAIYRCIDGRIKRLYTMDAMDSFGHFYSSITKYLGFKPFRHEGKILGLSAHGNPDNVKIPYPFVEKRGKIRYVLRKGLDVDPKLKKELDKYPKEDVAAWLQENMKSRIVDLASRSIRTTGMYDLVLVGGVFSNVRFNQAINEIPEVKSLYIFPEMGDGGLGVGAACYVYSQKNPDYINQARQLENVYLGVEFSEEEIEQALKEEGLKYRKPKNLAKDVAKLITKGNVVARFDGRMEFGPRALGNRSILYHAKDPSVNDWLNKRLERTEFMPFAPVTLAEYKDKCYKNIRGAEFSARFMTITFDCTDFMKRHSPAAVHVDGTARPQLIYREDNPGYYDILKEYHKLTKIPSIINTSFNMHEEPIVRSPKDAVRAFMLGHLDYLAIGKFLVENK
ncbi:MAG: carbamoyltransferase [Candidatus Woesearchaeota archaeon]|nr:carbamoyltransferase [Candidatus Woesearchaeota archaeon]